jgi:hypothetical protein
MVLRETVDNPVSLVALDSSSIVQVISRAGKIGAGYSAAAPEFWFIIAHE